MAVRATLVGTPGWVPTPHPRTAVGDGRSADRGQWGVEGAGARADRDAVGSGDHDRAVGRAPLGAQLAEPRGSDRGGAGVQRDAGGPHGCRWCGQRSVGATAPAAGGALGAGRQELAGGRERRFRSAGTGRCRQPSGTGTAGHESARSSRLGRGYGRLMNDSSRPPLPVSATSLLRYSVVAEVEALVLGGWPAAAAVRHVAGADRVDLDGRLVHISVRTLQRWRAAWASGKLAALEPRQRTRTTTSQALSVELVAFLRTEKRCDPRASAPELVRRARERGIVPADLKIDRTTVWRACRRMGLPTRRRPHKREGRHAALAVCRAHAVRARRRQAFPRRRGASAPGGAVLHRRCHALRPAGAGGHRGVQRVVPARPLRDGHGGTGLADLFFLDKGPGLHLQGQPRPWSRAAWTRC